MKIIKIFIISLLLLFISLSAFAYSPWDALVRHLNTCFSYGNIESYVIENITNNTVSFRLDTQPTLFPGRELIIKKGNNNPLSSETIGFAKFLGFFNQEGTAKIIYNFQNINKGDFLIKPYNRKIVLFSNVKDKYSFKPYIDLQQILTFNNYTVYEINKPDEINLLNQQEYNILVRLDISNGLLTGKIQSLYDNAILFNQVYQFPYQIATNFPANVDISFNQKQITTKFYGNRFTKNNSYITKSKKNLSDYSFTTGRKISKSQLTLTGDFEIIKYKLDRKAVRMVAADVDGDGHDEIVTISNYGIYLYKINETNLTLFASYPFADSDIIAIHLHKGDFNKNGKDELFVTLTKKFQDVDAIHNKLCSIILEYQGGKNFKIFNKNLEYYLRVVEDRRGKAKIICQSQGEYDPYEGKIYEMYWSGSKFKVGKPFEEAKNVYSIYGFAPHPDKKDYTMIIDRFGNIAGYYAPNEQKVELLSENLGIYNIISYPVKLKFEFYRGGYDKETAKDVYAYRRFIYKKEFNNQVFTIKTSYNKDITRKIISKILSKNEEPDKIVGIRWIGDTIMKTWESDEFYETIIDFSFLKENGKDILAVLVENKDEGFYIKLMK